MIYLCLLTIPFKFCYIFALYCNTEVTNCYGLKFNMLAVCTDFFLCWQQATGARTWSAVQTPLHQSRFFQGFHHEHTRHWTRQGRQIFTLHTQLFLPARRYASAGLCDSDVSVRLSVRPSVCLSHTGIVPSRAKVGSWNVYHLIAPSL